MKIEVWLIGKNDSTIQEGFEQYRKRLARYIPFSVRIFQENKKKVSTAEQIKLNESKLILSTIEANDYLIILDEQGNQFSSKQYANKINSYMVSGTKTFIFLVGGAYGFDKKIYERANEMLSLSKMTLSHQLARLIFIEQLYRAFTILNNEPYHHD